MMDFLKFWGERDIYIYTIFYSYVFTVVSPSIVVIDNGRMMAALGTMEILIALQGHRTSQYIPEVPLSRLPRAEVDLSPLLYNSNQHSGLKMPCKQHDRLQRWQHRWPTCLRLNG